MTETNRRASRRRVKGMQPMESATKATTTTKGPRLVVRETPGQPAELWTEHQFRSLLEKLPAGAYICDSGGLITFYNDRAVELWGRAPKLHDAEDRFCGSFKLFHSDGRPMRHEECWMARALETRAEYNGEEVVIERPDGRRMTALAHANPLRDEAGNLFGAVNVLIDITDRKRSEEALQAAGRSKDEFLATLAHELRNPLAPIRNAVEILHVQGPRDPESNWAIQVIDRQMQLMTRLIDDLMDVSRITRNKLELRRQRVTLAEVVRAAVETSRPLLEAEGHELTLSVPRRPIRLDADPTRLAQAISNLLNNAARYTEPGGHVWLTAERQGGEAVVSVKDTGIGIAAEMLPMVFELFAQGGRAGAAAEGGLGIGLTLVKRLVEMHGGTVQAASGGLGQGSVFTVRLPIDEGPAGEPEKRDGEGLTPTPPLRILVVDDNRDSAESLGMLFRLVGHEVRVAHDGLEAIAAAAELRPDAVVLDIGLPKLDGYGVAARIREEAWGRQATLIAVTGWGQKEDKERSRAAGFDHHLVKPVDPTALIRLLSEGDGNLPGSASGASRRS
jgi:PAS domain S-box-containing protein